MTMTHRTLGTCATWVALMLMTHVVSAGELVPYAPPMTQAALPSSSAQLTSASRATARVTVPAAVYEEFAVKVRALTPAQREELRKRLERSHEDARAAGDVSRDQHFHHLLDILGSKP
jgi:hypothetical protein